jgi:phospholipid/cholesterol/gamma-HCH transport system substrate-binding protein
VDARREQAIVGLFVVIAVALLLITVFMLGGVFGKSGLTYHTKFKFGGGLAEGVTVLYSGGPKAGRVTEIEIDPDDSSLIDVTFSVKPGIPIKTDSHVKIASSSALGDNHLEIVPGSSGAAPAPAGSWLIGDPYVDFNALTDKLNNMAPDAQKLLVNLNDRAEQLKITISRVNDLLNDENRANIAGTIAGARGLIADNRPAIKSTVDNLNGASAKLGPLLDNLRATSDEANKTLTHVDQLIGDERPDIHAAVVQLRTALTTLNEVAQRSNQLLETNSGNIDEILVNLREATANLAQFTSEIKSRPSTLIRSSSPKERKPGDPQ